MARCVSIRGTWVLRNTRREFMLGTWLAAAKAMGHAEEEKNLCEENARTLITYWARMIPRPQHAVMHIRNGRACWKISICRGGRCSSRISARGCGAGLGGKSITLISNMGGRSNVRTTQSILVAIPCALLPRLSPPSRAKGSSCLSV